MSIKSTGQSIKSTGQSTKSSMGGCKCTEHDDANPHPNPPSGNPSKHATRPETNYSPKSKDVTRGQNGVRAGSFEGCDARHEY